MFLHESHNFSSGISLANSITYTKHLMKSTFFVIFSIYVLRCGCVFYYLFTSFEMQQRRLPINCNITLIIKKERKHFLFFPFISSFDKILLFSFLFFQLSCKKSFHTRNKMKWIQFSHVNNSLSHGSYINNNWQCRKYTMRMAK